MMNRMLNCSRVVGQGILRHSVPFCALATRVIPNDGKTLSDFLSSPKVDGIHAEVNPEEKKLLSGHSFVIETYGCQMNTADSGIMETLLRENGMVVSNDETTADVIIMNTCSVREHAEMRIWNRLTQFRHLDKKKKKHTILCVSGCMASRLQSRLLDSGVDVVIGPDSYSHLPSLLTQAIVHGKQSFDTELNASEVYASIHPLFLDPQPSTQLTIMRGCDNMCSYCVVPYTRGRERSVPFNDVLDSIKRIRDHGYKEVMLLGQNVNSYHDQSSSRLIVFPELLQSVAEMAPEMRIRFMSPHPKDFPMDTLHVIRDHRNICQSLHLPLQSGSNSCLKRMNRPYDRDGFLQLVSDIRSILPDCSLSTDVITGFCGETEAEHEDTLDLMRQVSFDHAFMYLFSMRENTHAWRYYKDDVSLEVKKRRLTEIQNVFYESLQAKLEGLRGREELVLVEGQSKRSSPGAVQYKGRCDGNRMCVFDATPVYVSKEAFIEGGQQTDSIEVGDYIACEIITPGSGTHIVKPLFKTTLRDY